MVGHYVIRSFSIKAVQYAGRNAGEILDFGSGDAVVVDGRMMIKTEDGDKPCNLGDWVAKVDLSEKGEGEILEVFTDEDFQLCFQEVFPQKFYPFKDK